MSSGSGGGSGPPGAGVARVRGYRHALERAGRPFDPELVREGGWTRQGGREAMRALMSEDPHPDAVFCANDLLAIGMLQALAVGAVDVPGDIALIGYDDIDFARSAAVPLSSIRQPMPRSKRV